MPDIKLFKINSVNGDVSELTSRSAAKEKELQTLCELNLETLLGIRFLATEFVTSHRGRIDSLGLDENGCPVIIEYKRHANENVINQGLFYLNWLLDHKADFHFLVEDKLGRDEVENIEWSGARLICIATDFTRYDEHAIALIDRNIELMRYKYFGDDLFLLELVEAQQTQHQSPRSLSRQEPIKPQKVETGVKRSSNLIDTNEARLGQASEQLTEMYNTICDFAINLGDDVQRKELKLYTAFKRIKNFACIIVSSTQREPALRIYLKLNPDEVELIDGFVSDVRERGHWGTGDVEVIVRSVEDIKIANSLILKSYDKN
ncbi:DUF91 domain-containing protein [Veronia nyctiphanis]|uniref:DUF91 domain-containing protein n=1 Tax=Veronia nyctiphanis TaxID=1278244 RepID=A0A4Q0YNC7_9GAMM|nr:DUF5655 domain-containing protein [Veronia nyctiphanis]RXJ70651.1 DUF91 domain-containing protein [Veronia nyctiphanis]